MKRRHFDHFNIAGFTFYEGALAFEHLKIGTELDLKPEFENIYDDNAVAIYYNDYKLGFIPRAKNHAIAELMRAGVNVFETRVQRMCAEYDPEYQIQVIVYIKRGD
jgi:hypothetical protein